jgi:DNA-binding NtrC family response regulator
MEQPCNNESTTSRPEPGLTEAIRRARLLLPACGWDSVRKQLRPHIPSMDCAPRPTADRIEALCLYLAADMRLGESRSVDHAGDLLRGSLQAPSCLTAEARALATYVLAKRAVDLGHCDDAGPLIEAAADLPHSEISPWTQIRLLILSAGIDLRRGTLVPAEQKALSALEISSQERLVGSEADAYGLLAVLSRTRGDLQEAGVFSANAARLYWQVGDLNGHVLTLLNRAMDLLFLGLLPECRQLCQEVDRLAGGLGRAATLLRARIARGAVEAREGKTALARALLLSAIREARRRDMVREEAIALEFLGEAQILAGELARARVALHRGASMTQRAAPTGDVAVEIAVRTALLRLAEGRVLDAIELAQQASRRARAAGTRLEEAQSLRILATACVEAGYKSRARHVFRAALSLYEQTGEQLERRVVEAWLAALEEPSPGGHLHGGPTAGRVAGPRPNRVELPEGSETALAFWLNHPLLGPNSYRRRKTDRKHKRPVEERLGPAKGGQANVCPVVPRRRDWSRETIMGEHPAGGQRGTLGPGDDVADPMSALSPLWRNLGLVTRTPSVLDVLRMIETYAPGQIPVLILGETGTGKDLIAQGLHHLSGREGNYVPVNCAAARSELFVAELFGARRGAYTGAVEDRRGLVIEAEKGTLFFDEIADLGNEAQGFLLRFLDSGEVRAVGDTRARSVATRVVAATCGDLPTMVAEERFRADLYGRLAGLVLRIPALRDRIDDLNLLIDTLWQRGGGHTPECGEVFNEGVLGALRRRYWPGNVRELKHVVDRAILEHRRHGATAARAALLDRGKAGNQQSRGSSRRRGAQNSGRTPTGNALHAGMTPTLQPSEWDPDLLRDALEEAGGVIPEAARLLGLSRAHAYKLYARMRHTE